MSIFLDPTGVPTKPTAPVVGPQFPNTPKFSDRNDCHTDDPCVAGDCAPLPYLNTDATQGPGCIIVTKYGIGSTATTATVAPASNQLTTQTLDSAYFNQLALENLHMGGANACVYKMLGVKQQGTLIDAAGFGCAIASDSLAEFPPSNAFDRFATEWRSDASGANLKKSFIGYDFGVVTRESGVQQYSNEANGEARKHITAFAIKQAGDVNNWVTKVRVERSDDGVRWFGVDVVDLPPTTDRTQFAIKQSVPSRMWRLTPVKECLGRWFVDSLELFEFVQTDLQNIQNSPLFQENRDRSYCVNPVKIKMYYDLIDINTELARFGIDLPSATMTLTVHFAETVRQLGRGMVIGDIIEVPSELQFTPDMQIVRKYVEVTDVSWSTRGYTPGWTPLFQRVVARPMLARQEVLDIVGSLEPDTGEGGLGFNSPNTIFSTSAFQASEAIQTAADTMTQQLGVDEQIVADISEIPQQHLEAADTHKINIARLTTNYNDNRTTRTGMPPAGTPPEMFSIGEHSAGFPQNPRNNQYHRMTYDTLATDKVPPRLYRYSLAKNRWMYLETDERWAQQANKGRLKSYLVDDQRVNLQDIK